LPERHSIGFNQGVPVSLDGAALSAVAIIEKLEALAGPSALDAASIWATP